MPGNPRNEMLSRPPNGTSGRHDFGKKGQYGENGHRGTYFAARVTTHPTPFRGDEQPGAADKKGGRVGLVASKMVGSEAGYVRESACLAVEGAGIGAVVGLGQGIEDAST